MVSRRTQNQSGGGLCWWPNDERRDTDAHALLGRGHLRDLAIHSNRDGYMATCTSSSQLGVCYQPQLHRNGYAQCDCPDFANRGGACKHLRAFRLIVDGWIQTGQIEPFMYPATLSAARRVCPLQTPNPLPSSNQHLPASSGISQATGSASATVDNLLALQNFASQSEAPVEPFADENEDGADDAASNYSDDSSHSTESAAGFLRVMQSVVSSHNQLNMTPLMFICY